MDQLPRFRNPSSPASDASSLLAGSARRLDRAAAPAAGSAPALHTTLGHVQGALGQVERAFYVMAAAVQAGDEDSGEAEALAWHLAETARRLQAAGDACSSSRRWARRFAEPGSTPAADLAGGLAVRGTP